MATFVKNEKELGQAIKGNCDEIEVSFDLTKQVLAIKAVGNVAWVVAVAALVVAIGAVLSASATGHDSNVVKFAALGPAAAALGGTGLATTALSIAVAGGGIGALNKLRDYSATKLSDGHVLLKKK